MGVAALFLDRDGVINVRLPGRYVEAWEQFRFRQEFLDAAPALGRAFPLIVVVTNQRGVERGHLTEETLGAIHDRMVQDVARAGGRIDAVYFCPHEQCEDRKPNPGLLLRAARDHGIDLGSSTMVGDQPSDREAAGRAGIGRYVDVTDLASLAEEKGA